ncbi:hypothetical protein KC887_02790 [Candidatus Kaiserbacteria bacterium]|nr:hypothetical protein [Candidatus Kaiserbacteria bacterium]
MPYTYTRGHKIEWDEDAQVWRYADTGEVAFAGDGEFGGERPCAFCHQMPTVEGHDACLGELPGVLYACCGHGVENEHGLSQPYIKYARWPFWMTNPNYWPAVIAVCGFLPLVITTWLLVCGRVSFAVYLLVLLFSVVLQVASALINRKQRETAVFLKQRRQRAFATGAVGDLLSHYEEEGAHFLVGVGAEKKAE